MRKVGTKINIVFFPRCASAVDDVSLIRQSRCLNGSYVPHMSHAFGIPVAMYELESARPLGIYTCSKHDRCDCQSDGREDVCCCYLLAVSRPSGAV